MTQNVKVVAKNKRLSDELVLLKSKVEDIEQRNLGITVDRTGVPKTTNENCITIVEEIAKKN